MTIRAQGYNFSLVTVLKMAGRSLVRRILTFALPLVLGSVAVAAISTVSRGLAIAGMCLLLIIMFFVERHMLLSYGWPRKGGLRFKPFVLGFSGLLFLLIFWLAFFAWKPHEVARESLLILGVTLSASLAGTLLPMLLWYPIAFDDWVCTDCGIVMDIKNVRSEIDYIDQDAGPGRVIRQPSGVIQVTTFRCPKCKQRKERAL